MFLKTPFVKIIVCLVIIGRSGVALADDAIVVMATRGTSTELLSLSLFSKRLSSVFDDRDLPFRINPINLGLGKWVISPNRMLMYAAIFSTATDPNASPKFIYEISLDGSRHYQKFIDLVEGEQLVQIFVSPSGGKLGTIVIDPKGAYRVRVYGSTTGALIRTLQLDNFSSTCPIRNVGFLKDESTLFVTLSRPDEEDEIDSPNDVDTEPRDAHVGNWLVPEDQARERRIDPAMTFFDRRYIQGGQDRWPTMIGDDANGSYVFHAEMYKIASNGLLVPGHRTYHFFIYTKPQSRVSSVEEVNAEGFGVGSLVLSPSRDIWAYTRENADGALHGVNLYLKSSSEKQPRQIYSFSSYYPLLVAWIHR